MWIPARKFPVTLVNIFLLFCSVASCLWSAPVCSVAGMSRLYRTTCLSWDKKNLIHEITEGHFVIWFQRGNLLSVIWAFYCTLHTHTHNNHFNWTWSFSGPVNDQHQLSPVSQTVFTICLLEDLLFVEANWFQFHMFLNIGYVTPSLITLILQGSHEHFSPGWISLVFSSQTNTKKRSKNSLWTIQAVDVSGSHSIQSKA